MQGFKDKAELAKRLKSHGLSVPVVREGRAPRDGESFGKHGCSEEDLVAIRALADPPVESLGLDDFAVRRFRVCNDLLDHHRTHFRTEDLPRMGQLLIGRPLLAGHNTTPLGRWFSPDVVERMVHDQQGSGAMVKASFLRGRAYFLMPERAQLVREVDAGIVRESSVNVWPSFMRCDLCGEDFLDGSKCKHWPGQVYDGVECTLTLEMVPEEGAEMLETSLVYAGSQVGTGQERALRLDELGGLEKKNDSGQGVANPKGVASPSARNDLSVEDVTMEWTQKQVELLKKAGKDPSTATLADLEKAIEESHAKAATESSASVAKAIEERDQALKDLATTRSTARAASLSQQYAPSVVKQVQAIEAATEKGVLLDGVEKAVPLPEALDALVKDVADLAEKGLLRVADLTVESGKQGVPKSPAEGDEDDQQAMHKAIKQIQAELAEKGLDASYARAWEIYDERRKAQKEESR